MSADLGVALQSNFGFKSFRHGQEEAIESLLADRHVLAVMPTGSGKSLIYQLAAIQRSGTTIVISPLIALMQDQVASLERRRIRATFINSQVSVGEQGSRLKAMAAGQYRLVYIAPERLRSQRFMDALSKAKVSMLAVDEAHCISEWGHDFRPDYLRIGAARAMMGHPVTAALTATATPSVQDDIVRMLDISSATRLVTGFNRPNLCFNVCCVPDVEDKLRALRRSLSDLDGGAIIYTGTRRDTEEVAEFVRTVLRINADHYHAGLDAAVRTQVQSAFLSGSLPVVVATNAFGMGIDRPDVRLVVHYSVPGTLEAYYQEAGRAGRDGNPARAVLLYSPKDRALQEWFIESEECSARDLRMLYDALCSRRKRESWITHEELSIVTGFHDVKIRLGLAHLETSGAVHRLGDEGLRMLVCVGAWNDAAIHSAVRTMEARQRHRLAQLGRMIAYAESDGCRRRVILDHFGDQGSAEAEECCDNCTSEGGLDELPDGDLSDLDEAGYAILKALRDMKWEIGTGKLARLLMGSRSKAMRQFGYDQLPSYAALDGYTRDEVKDLISQLVAGRFIKTIGGVLPVLKLTPLAESALSNPKPLGLRLVSRENASCPRRITRPRRQRGESADETGRLLAEGMTPDEIAVERGLTVNTVCSHLASMVAKGSADVTRIVTPDVLSRVRAAIGLVGDVSALSPIKLLLPESISYGEIRCVVEAWKLDKGIQSPQPKDEDIAECGESDTRDEVTEFLSTSHPKPLSGPWHSGWALDFHSRFDGAEWSRGSVGELAYRLKYQSDPTAVQPLVEHMMALIAEHPELADIDGIIPMPPSTERSFDPVSAVADELGRRLKKKSAPVLVRVRATAPQKEMSSMAQKRANVTGALAVRANIRGRKVLLLDDLYDSGMTLQEAARVLSQAGASRICVLTLTRTIHTDA